MDATLQVEDPVTDEELDLHQEEHEVKNLQDVLVDLQDIYKEIEKKKGVNKTLALAIESIRPGILSDKTPVNSFTGELSAINLTSSMEDVIGGIVETIKFIARGVGKIISKIVEFIKRLVGRFKDKQKRNQDVVVRAKALTDEIYLLKGKIGARDHKLFDDVFKEVAAEANEELRMMHNDLLREMLLGGKVRAAMLAVGGDFSRYVSELNSKFIVIEKAIRESKQINEPQTNYLLSEVDKYIKTGQADGILRSVLSGEGNGTVATDLVLLKDFIYHLAESKVTNQLNYQTVFDSIRSGRISLADNYILDVSYSEKNLEVLEKKAMAFERSADNLKTSFNIQLHIKDSLKVLREEVMALQMYIVSCNKLLTVNGISSNFIYTYTNRHYKKLLAAAKGSDDIVTVNAAKESAFKNK